MNRNSIRWRLPVSYAVIALLAALSLGSMMLLVLRSYYAEEERQYLHRNATVLRPVIEQILQSELSETAVQDQIKGLSFLSQAQIRVLDTNGNVLADSGVPDADQVLAVSGGAPFVGNVMFSMRAAPPVGSSDQGPVLIYHSDEIPLPETTPMQTPMAGNKTQIAGQKSADIILRVNPSPYGYGFVARAELPSNRRSSQSVSVPLTGANGQRLGLLEFSKGPSYGADIVRSVSLAWFIASIFAIAIAALTGWFMSQRVTRPVLVLEQATRQMEQGNLAVRVDLQGERQQEFMSLAKSFNGMAAQVEQTISTLRAFVADAAHELHTPLTALQVNLELAHEEGNPSDRIRFLARAQEQAHRLEALVESLLDLSRIEAAETKSSFTSFDLAQLLREVVEPFASRAEQTERIFTIDLPPGGIEISGNEGQLRQLIVNLLENALKFTPVGGRITLSVARASGEIQLTVSDSGIGIPAGDLPHLFERFHRARNASAYPGNGLGLAIVKAIVQLHRGQVVVESQEKQGTLVRVSLPTD